MEKWLQNIFQTLQLMFKISEAVVHLFSIEDSMQSVMDLLDALNRPRDLVMKKELR